MATIGSGTMAAGLTAAALAVVGVLAFQMAISRAWVRPGTIGRTDQPGPEVGSPADEEGWPSVATIGSGTIVAGLTAAALAVVGVLAFQAAEAAPEKSAGPKGPSAASASASVRASESPDARPGGGPQVPAGSGTGKRVVYSLEHRRVWLVQAGERVLRSYEVMPSTLSPKPGRYTVTSRAGRITGSDGVPIEHVVRFANIGGAVVGFSAALDGSMPTPQPGTKTGGIRQTRENGAALWQFAAVGVPVVVVA